MLVNERLPHRIGRYDEGYLAGQRVAGGALIPRQHACKELAARLHPDRPFAVDQLERVERELDGVVCGVVGKGHGRRQPVVLEKQSPSVGRRIHQHELGAAGRRGAIPEAGSVRQPVGGHDIARNQACRVPGEELLRPGVVDLSCRCGGR